MKVDPLFRAGLVLGLGLGGFADGIVLHQILQWHHLVCVTEHCQPQSIEHLKQQNVQDGYFHLAMWLLSILGVVLLFQAGQHRTIRWSGRALFGSIIAGWGSFNLIEGLIDHQILGIHHVLPGSPVQFLADMLFLASGVLGIVVGWLMAQPRSGLSPSSTAV